MPAENTVIEIKLRIIYRIIHLQVSFFGLFHEETKNGITHLKEKKEKKHISEMRSNFGSESSGLC